MKNYQVLLLSALAGVAMSMVGMGQARAADVTDSLEIGFTVENQCMLTVLDFESSGMGLSLEVNSQMVDGVRILCNEGVAYSITAGEGLHFGMNPDYPNRRGASNGVEAIAYQLHQDLAGTIDWSAESPITGVGDGTLQLLPYSISFYMLQNFVADRYTDSVVITASYF